MIAYVPNTEKNRRLIAKQFTVKSPVEDDKDFEIINQGQAKFMGEMIECYLWVPDKKMYQVQTDFHDVLHFFLENAGFEEVEYSPYTPSRNKFQSDEEYHPAGYLCLACGNDDQAAFEGENCLKCQKIAEKRKKGIETKFPEKLN